VSDNSKPTVQGASSGGIAGTHPPADPLQLLVGPTTGNEFNTARLRPIPLACWRVDDLRFQFDSSFVLPDTREEFGMLADLIAQHTSQAGNNGPKKVPPISLFGHADPVGKDDYNKYLSGRRAAAIYGALTRRPEIWEDLYTNQGAWAGTAIGDQWGVSSIQAMLNELAGPVTVDGKMGPETQTAIQQFQTKNGLPADGQAGPATRQKLYLAYMDSVCVDSQGNPLKVDQTQGFLAQGQDAAGKGDFQGCGEFNPVLIFSQQKEAMYDQSSDHTTRDDDNAPNRRVVALLFRPESIVDPLKWPCPRAKDGTSGCIKRFWSDGEQRRSTQLPDTDRKYENTHDTFACRFYDRMLQLSPCERTLISFEIRLYDLVSLFIANAPYQFTLGGRAPVKGSADAQGLVRFHDIQVPAQLAIQWGFPVDTTVTPVPDPDYVFSLNMYLTPDQPAKEDEARQKLHNLGYPDQNDLSTNVSAFQGDYGDLANPPLATTGVLDDSTLDLIRKVYRSCEDDLREDPPQ
jgi:outer membrane protein OmpA-like peptidoglycan-associated protein